MTKRSDCCRFMIQHLTSIIHSEITGPLWKVVTYLPYERKLRAYWEHFDFRRVACVGVRQLSLSWCPAEGSSFGKGCLRKVNWACKARIHTCGKQLFLHTVFQRYPGQVGSLSAFCGRDSNLVPCHHQTQMCWFFFFWAPNPCNLPKINQTSHQGTEIILLLISSFA